MEIKTTTQPYGSQDQIHDALKRAEKVVTMIQEAIPYAEGLASFVPGFGPRFAVALHLANACIPAILKAMEAIMEINGGDLVSAHTEIVSHINPKTPNSLKLDGKPDPYPITPPT